MTILERIKADTVDAMRAGDKERVSALRMLSAELQKNEKDGGDDELVILRRERKRRRESQETFSAAGRNDLAKAEAFEAELIAAYLPAELSESELTEFVTAAIAEIGATSPKETGLVMKAVMAKVDGRADGKVVSAKVREALS